MGVSEAATGLGVLTAAISPVWVEPVGPGKGDVSLTKDVAACSRCAGACRRSDGDDHEAE
jgi:hypothetical protein